MYNMTTKNIIKIIIVVILTTWIFGVILAYGSSKTKTSEAQATVKELIELKDQKQQCKDSLNYQETIEEYKGLFHCNENDERISELKSLLKESLLNDYEQVDSIIMEKQLQMIAENTWSKLAQLEAFLQSE